MAPSKKQQKTAFAMSASAYINPKPCDGYASARASMSRLNRISPETTPGVRSCRDFAQYVEDKPDVEAMTPSMTLFPFSYEHESTTVDTDGCFSVNVSPEKKLSPVRQRLAIRV